MRARALDTKLIVSFRRIRWWIPRSWVFRCYLYRCEPRSEPLLRQTGGPQVNQRWLSALTCRSTHPHSCQMIETRVSSQRICNIRHVVPTQFSITGCLPSDPLSKVRLFGCRVRYFRCNWFFVPFFKSWLQCWKSVEPRMPKLSHSLFRHCISVLTKVVLNAVLIYLDLFFHFFRQYFRKRNLIFFLNSQTLTQKKATDEDWIGPILHNYIMPCYFGSAHPKFGKLSTTFRKVCQIMQIYYGCSLPATNLRFIKLENYWNIE